jgi:acetyl/propionyl-CoA carboxylase alpha subunit
MRRALQEYEIGGIKTTLPFFREIVEDEEFIGGRLDTGFISRFNDRKQPRKIDPVESDMAVLAAALAFSGKASVPPVTLTDQQSPSRWAMSGRFAGVSRQ